MEYKPESYKLSLSYISNNSSGFDSDFSDITSDVEPIVTESNLKEIISNSCDSLMDSDVLYDMIECSQDYCIEQQQQQTTFISVFESNQLNSNQTQLWQFLLEILEDKKYENLIRWTPTCVNDFSESNINKPTVHDNEFIICDTKEIARLWGIRRSKPNMTQKKFNRVLRHYYNKKNFLKKPAGKHNTYVFLINIQPYLHFIKLEQEKLNKISINTSNFSKCNFVESVMQL